MSDFTEKDIGTEMQKIFLMARNSEITFLPMSTIIKELIKNLSPNGKDAMKLPDGQTKLEAKARRLYLIRPDFFKKIATYNKIKDGWNIILEDY